MRRRWRWVGAWLACAAGCLPSATSEVTPIGDADDLRADGADCAQNAECVNVCLSGTCGPAATTGGGCDEDDDCTAGHVCFEGSCRLEDGESCSDDDECRHSCLDTTCGLFDRTTVSPEVWPELQERLLAAAAEGNAAAPEARLLTGDFSALPNGRYQGAVLGPDGMVYATPRSGARILRLDPETGATIEVGPEFDEAAGWRRDKWYGARLAADGTIIAVASDEARSLRYDPLAPEGAAVFGDTFPEADDDETACTDVADPGCNKWKGAAWAPNGRLIACPRTGPYVLEIDPASDTTNRITDPSFGTTPHKWIGAVLAPNGLVYCLPHADAQILEIDPEDLTPTGIRRVGPVFDATVYPELTDAEDAKWYGGTLGANGKIYASPGEAPKVLQVDPEDLSATGTRMVGADVASAVGGLGWGPSALAPDGRIYAPPQGASGILVIDPDLLDVDPDDPNGTWTFDVTPTALPAQWWDKFYGVALAPNGKLYAFPWYQVTQILEIDPHANGTFDPEVLHNGFLNGQ